MSMEELTALLNKVEDSYYDFVLGITQYCKKKTSRLEAVLKFMKEHPGAKSSDIVYFVSTQPDFMEDASMMRVG